MDLGFVPVSKSSDVSVGHVSATTIYREEINALVKLFNEEKDVLVVLKCRKDTGAAGSNVQRQKIALYLEGSRLPFSALVKYVFDKLSAEIDEESSKRTVVTLASVRSIVLSLGERVSFGITNPDTDVLEDDCDGSLWRWEVRDLKLIPKGSRDEIVDRRRWLKKIADRIAALAATCATLDASNDAAQDEIARAKAMEGLSKIDDESAIRAAKITWQLKRADAISGQQRNSVTSDAITGHNAQQDAGGSTKRRKSDPEEKERLRLDKLLKRQQAENEKEQKRKDREDADRKKQHQRQQDEAEREIKRKDREEIERKKLEKKLLEEAERMQKREVERRKQLALKKQASFMDKFLVKKYQGSCGQCHQTENDTLAPGEESHRVETESQSEQAGDLAATVARMDAELQGDHCVGFERLWRSHLDHWLNIRSVSASRKPLTWGIRRKPKVSVYRELRLQGTSGDSRACSPAKNPVRKISENSSPCSTGKRPREEFACSEVFGDNIVESFPSSPVEESKKLSSDKYHLLRKKKRKLLQFDKSHRPPYYGTFSKKNEFIKPRNPLNQDPTLDYDVDSDDEWEEEDPGESLSDAEKEEEDEKVEIEDVDEEEDEFVVPDGYLSEDEGVAMEDHERNIIQEGSSALSPKTPVPNNVMSSDRLRKVLDNATEHALRSNHPLVVSNLGHPVDFASDHPSSQFPTSRTETMCLEALRIRVLVPNMLIGAC